MRVVCPTCTAAYDVPASVLAAPRTMRCARCATDFTASPASTPGAPDRPAPVPSQAALPVTEPLPVIRTAGAERLTPAIMGEAPTPDRRRMAGVLAAWVLSLVLLGAGGWAGIARRDAVMRSWPASNRLYAALGYVR